MKTDVTTPRGGANASRDLGRIATCCTTNAGSVHRRMDPPLLMMVLHSNVERRRVLTGQLRKYPTTVPYAWWAYLLSSRASHALLAEAHDSRNRGTAAGP